MDTMHHAFHKAPPGRPYFRSRNDFPRFEELLADGKKHFAMKVYAYCLMPNHWHLVIQGQRRESVRAFLRWLSFRASSLRSRQHELYGLRAVNAPEHFYRLCRYVERNPVTAGLAERAEDWRWSSFWLRANAPGAVKELILDPWPEGVPDDWSRLVNAPYSQSEHDHAFKSLNA
jgi:putative transposase